VSLTDIEAVYRSRGADFFRLALVRTGDGESARDAVQEGFARAIRGRHSFRGAGPLEAWIARCVMNAAHDLARRTQLAAEGDLPSEDSDLAAAEGHAVREALRRLPPRQRDALFLRFYLDFDYATIAEALGIEVGTVSATLHAARATLADNLQEVTK
jgi:RNA polymerase sigma factor (sigma-70 family)